MSAGWVSDTQICGLHMQEVRLLAAAALFRRLPIEMHPVMPQNTFLVHGNGEEMKEPRGDVRSHHCNEASWARVLASKSET